MEQNQMNKIFDSNEFQLSNIQDDLVIDKSIKKIKVDNQQNINYKLVDSIKSPMFNAIAFNNDSTIMIVGYYRNNIKVFDFKDGKVNMKQILNDHEGSIFCLMFMKLSNQFISGSFDASIRLWQLNNDNQWYCKQKLEGHLKDINCFVINKEDNLIISGSKDRSIKFWILKDGIWECNQTIRDHKTEIQSISLNENQNIIVSCAYQEKSILVFKKIECLWTKIQSIDIEKWGYRICFINDRSFVFQPYNYHRMEIYQLDTDTQQFINNKQVPLKSSGNCGRFFPIYYLKEQNLIINKNGNQINVIRIKQNGDFVIEQEVKLSSGFVQGGITQDGHYLVTYDDRKRLLQFRENKP